MGLAKLNWTKTYTGLILSKFLVSKWIWGKKEKCKIFLTTTTEYLFTNCSGSILQNINIPPHTTALRTFYCNLPLLLLLVNTRPLKPNCLEWSGIALMFIMELKLAHRAATSDPSQQTFHRWCQGPRQAECRRTRDLVWESFVYKTLDVIWLRISVDIG